MCESEKWPGRYYLLKWPSDRAMASIKATAREMTQRRFVGLSLDVVVDRLNPALRGWAGYFRHGNSSRKFAAVDSYVHQRMAILASNKHGRSGRNWATRFNYGWLTSLGIYRLNGTVGNRSAHALGLTGSESRVPENGMHGLIGGRWGGGCILRGLLVPGRCAERRHHHGLGGTSTAEVHC